MTRSRAQGQGSNTSSWNRTPEALDVEASDPPDSTERPGVRESAERDAARVLRESRAVAGRVGRHLQRGFERVSDALEDPTSRAHQALVEQSNLPELDGADAMSALAKRLDCEADLWRGIVLQQHARSAWLERLTVTTAAIALVGTTALSGVAGFRALFSPAEAQSIAGLVGAGVFALLAGAFTIGQLASRARQGHQGVARDALVRADLAETRLHRLATLMELRRVDEKAYAVALQSLEREIRAD